MPNRIIIPASLMKVKTVDDLELWHMRRSQESPETVLEEIGAWNALMESLENRESSSTEQGIEPDLPKN